MVSAKMAAGLFMARMPQHEFDELFDALMSDDVDPDLFEFKLTNAANGDAAMITLVEAREMAASALTARTIASLIDLDEADFIALIPEMPDRTISIMATGFLKAIDVAPNDDIRARLLKRHPLMVAECELRDVEPFVFADETMEA